VVKGLCARLVSWLFVKGSDMRIVDRASVLGGVNTTPGELSVNDRGARGRLEGNADRVTRDSALRVEVVGDSRDQGTRGRGEGSLGKVNGANTVGSSVSVSTEEASFHTQGYRQHRRIRKPMISC